MSARHRGFTLVEIVVAIAIGSVVIVFAAMFITAPLAAYEAQSRRSVLVADVAAAWPLMQPDLREALPNSLRTRRNGDFVVLEMLAVEGVSRYMTAMGATFTAAGTANGLFSNTPATLTNNGSYYLSVNNRGEGAAGANAYALSGSMTPVRPQITFVTGLDGQGLVTVNPAPAFTAGDSPRRRVYLVREAVTFLCDEGQGTLRRYSGYNIAANQAARDAPNEFGSATGNLLIARGLTSCNFSVSTPNATTAQTVAARLTATRNGETMTLLHSSRAEYAP